MPTAGQHTGKLVEFIDIYPTLAEFAGLKLPAMLEGKSFLPLLKDLNSPGKEAAFSAYQKKVAEMGGTVRGRAMRTERYRLIEWAALKSDKRVYELYDEQVDPGENTNIANEPENKELLAKLVEQLHEGFHVKS